LRFEVVFFFPQIPPQNAELGPELEGPPPATRVDDNVARGNEPRRGDPPGPPRQAPPWKRVASVQRTVWERNSPLMA